MYLLLGTLPAGTDAGKTYEPKVFILLLQQSRIIKAEPIYIDTVAYADQSFWEGNV